MLYKQHPHRGTQEGQREEEREWMCLRGRRGRGKFKVYEQKKK